MSIAQIYNTTSIFSIPKSTHLLIKIRTFAVYSKRKIVLNTHKRRYLVVCVFSFKDYQNVLYHMQNLIFITIYTI